MNSTERFIAAANERSVPQELIDYVVELRDGDSSNMNYLTEGIERTTTELWEKAKLAKEGKAPWLSEYFSLLWAISEQGRGAYSHVETKEQRELRADICKTISTLKKQLRRQSSISAPNQVPDHMVDMGLYRLLSYSDSPEAKRCQYAMALAGDTYRNPDAIRAFNCSESQVRGLRAFFMEDKPSVVELLDCLSSAVQKNYDPADAEVCRSSRGHPDYVISQEGQGKAQVRYCIYQIIEWFYAYQDTAPKAEIVLVAKHLPGAKSMDLEQVYADVQKKLRAEFSS